MSAVVTQFGVLAQQPDLENWANLLVVVVMAGLWLAGGLLKAMSKKKSAQEAGQGGAARPGQPPRESWQQRLARKAEELQRAIEQGELPPSEPASRPPQPPTGKIIVRQGPRGESVMVYEPAEPQPPAQPEPRIARPRPEVKAPAATPRTILKKPPAAPLIADASRSTPAPVTDKASDVSLRSAVSKESPEEKAETAPESAGPSPTVLDYSDPDALRKAILHYEILGTPLAMREPFE